MHVYLLSSEELHAEQRKDEDEQEEEEQQRHDGPHRVEEWDHQVAQTRPVAAPQNNNNNNNVTTAQLASDDDMRNKGLSTLPIWMICLWINM